MRFAFRCRAARSASSHGQFAELLGALQGETLLIYPGEICAVSARPVEDGPCMDKCNKTGTQVGKVISGREKRQVKGAAEVEMKLTTRYVDTAR